MSLRMWKRVIVAGIAMGGIAYSGDAMNVQERIHTSLNAAPPVEEGYADPRAVRVMTQENGDGTAKTLLSYGGEALPLLLGEKGLQLGEVMYVWENFDRQEQRSITERAWNEMAQEIREGYMHRTLEELNADVVHANLSPEQQQGVFERVWRSTTDKGGLVTEAWPSLDWQYRKPIVQHELEQLLEGK